VQEELSLNKQWGFTRTKLTRKMNRSLVFGMLAFLWAALGFSQDWQTNFEDAKHLAKNEHKPIILVFQGSDWCAPCIKLGREVWSTAPFISYATEHYVMLQADFPRKKQNTLSNEQIKSNNMLAEKYNNKGIFPLVVLLDAGGNELGRTGYKKLSPKGYIDELNQYLK